MRILFLTPQLPYPPHQGTQIRNFHLLKAAASAHQVDLISFARPGEGLENAGLLKELCGQVRLIPAPVRSLRSRLGTLVMSPDPDMAHRLASQDFAEGLRSLLEQRRYDLLQVAGLEMAQYLPLAREAAPRSAVVFDDHNAEYLLQARAAAVDARHPASWPRALYSLAQWLRLRRYEALICSVADAVLAVSQADAAALRRLGTSARITVVPNGVDTGYYCPVTKPGFDRDGDPEVSQEPDPAALLFTGTMDYRPNVDAVRWLVSAVLPAVAARKPEVSLRIVGRSPAPAVLQLASHNPRVVVTGPVEDVRPHFRRSAVYLVPMRMAGGARLKVMEALAMGLPMVSTRLGIEGVDLVEGKEVILADGAEEFADAVVRLLEDPSRRQRLAQAGRQAAEERFDWERFVPVLLEAYQQVKEAS